MKTLLLTLLHLAVMTAKLCGPGVRALVVAVHRAHHRQSVARRSLSL
ncbi:MAG: hypothetical protein ABI988_19650 [Nitrospirota bacterium]